MAQDAVSREAVFKVTDSATSTRHSPSKPLSRYAYSKSRAVVNCKQLHKDRTNLPKGSIEWGIAGWPMPYTLHVLLAKARPLLRPGQKAQPRQMPGPCLRFVQSSKVSTTYRDMSKYDVKPAHGMNRSSCSDPAVEVQILV